MRGEYKVNLVEGNIFAVSKIANLLGQDTLIEMYRGSPVDCEAYIRLFPIEKQFRTLPPPPPMGRVVNDMVGGCCPLCGSSYGRIGILNFFGKESCVNPRCENY